MGTMNVWTIQLWLIAWALTLYLVFLRQFSGRIIVRPPDWWIAEQLRQYRAKLSKMWKDWRKWGAWGWGYCGLLGWDKEDEDDGV